MILFNQNSLDNKQVGVLVKNSNFNIKIFGKTKKFM